MAKSKIIPVRFSAIEMAWIAYGQKQLHFDTRSDLIRTAWKAYLKNRGIDVTDVPEFTTGDQKEPSHIDGSGFDENDLS